MNAFRFFGREPDMIRKINGNVGSAIATLDPIGVEYKLAVFPDAGIVDFAMVSEQKFVVLSAKRQIAIVDLASRSILLRGRLSFQASHIVADPTRNRVIAYNCSPGLISTFSLSELKEIRRYNLLQARSDGAYDLLFRDDDQLKELGIPWDRIPHAVGPLGETNEPSKTWLDLYPDVTTSLRRITFSQNSAKAKAVCHKDGHLVIPYAVETGPSESLNNNAILSELSAGIATIDINSERLELKEICQKKNLPKEYYSQVGLPIQSINTNATRATLRSFNPVHIAETSDEDASWFGAIKTFGRKTPMIDAFGLEIWAIDQQVPQLVTTIGYQPLRDEYLSPTDMQRFTDAEIVEASREIDLLMPGLVAVFSGDQNEWSRSDEKLHEDSYFEPREAQTVPNFNPAWRRVHHPLLFGRVFRALAKTKANPLANIPWDILTKRQCDFIETFLRAWGQHSLDPVKSILWMKEDRFIVLGHNGIVREISLQEGPGEAYQLVHPATKLYPFVDRRSNEAKLSALNLLERKFAVDTYLFYSFHRFEFILPKFTPAKFAEREKIELLEYRLVVDNEVGAADVIQVDRLAAAIRPGYIKIKTTSPSDIIDGLQKLAPELQKKFNEIVVDDRWVPTLYHRGKQLDEKQFCSILIDQRSQSAQVALETLLKNFLDLAGDRAGSIWDPEGFTPAMAPTAIALIQLCDFIPEAVFRYFALRDMNHDMWTPVRFSELNLSPSRLAARDLLALQIRLAIQDICTGNPKPYLFALYSLNHVRIALYANPSLSSGLADIIVEQLREQTPKFSFASAAGALGVLQTIINALDHDQPAEASLVQELLDRRHVLSGGGFR